MQPARQPPPLLLSQQQGLAGSWRQAVSWSQGEKEQRVEDQNLQEAAVQAVKEAAEDTLNKLNGALQQQLTQQAGQLAALQQQM